MLFAAESQLAWTQAGTRLVAKADAWLAAQLQVVNRHMRLRFDQQTIR
jgi:hypothetical protein